MYQLDITNCNGLTTLFAHMPDANSTTVQLFAKAGNIYETRKTNGLSHFLEHMFFKGWLKYKTPEDVAATVDSFGGMMNAFTGDEYAGYYIKCAPQYTTQALDVLADMMIHPKFPIDEMEREKGVVIQEIMMTEDDPMSLVMDKFRGFYYGDNSFWRSILWPVDNIKSFTQDDLFAHKESLYTQDNMILVVAGAISNQAELQNLIGDLFAKLPTHKNIATPALSDYSPTQSSYFTDKGTNQIHMVRGASGYDMFQEERFGAKLLSVILGGNMSSRLFQNIREKQGLCYYISWSHSQWEMDGLFMMRAGIEKERFDFGREAIMQEIDKIVGGDINQTELDKAIWYMTGKTQMGIESSDELADFVGMQYLFKKEVKTLEDLLQWYKKTSLTDIHRIASKLSRDTWKLYYIK